MENKKNQLTKRALLSTCWKINQFILQLSVNKNRKLLTKDRNIIERIIFRNIYTNPDIKKILFVGCHLYSSWYHKIFNLSGKEFHTIDPDPESKKYGSPQMHITGKFELLKNQPKMFKNYDCVILNGVFGYGINSLADKISALEAAHKILKENAIMLIGFRNQSVPDIDLDIIDEIWFDAHFVPGFDSNFVETGHSNGHSFVCFKNK